MEKNDVALGAYFSDPQIFADLFNAWMYGGKQVIDPGSLMTEDSVQPRPEYARPYKHVRDVVKMYQKDGVQLVLLGIETRNRSITARRSASCSLTARTIRIRYEEQKRKTGSVWD